MDNLKLTGQNLDRVFNSRCGCAWACRTVTTLIQTAQLKPENSAPTTSRLSPVDVRAPQTKI
jgi:hypothetical protein